MLYMVTRMFSIQFDGSTLLLCVLRRYVVFLMTFFWHVLLHFVVERFRTRNLTMHMSAFTFSCLPGDILE
jgi:hypothetical protein